MKWRQSSLLAALPDLLLAEAMANVNKSFVSHLASQATLYAFPLSGQSFGTKRPNILTNGTRLQEYIDR